jgi:hypothetical protein
MVKKASAVKKSVTSKTLAPKKAPKAKKPRVETVQENLKAFAFPTTASMAEAAPPVPALGARVVHDTHGEGIFEGLVTVGTAAVLFDRDNGSPLNVPFNEIRVIAKSDDLEFPKLTDEPALESQWSKTKKAKAKKPTKLMTAPQELKKVFKLAIGDKVNVPGLGNVCTITQAERNEDGVLVVTALPSDSEIPVTCFAVEALKLQGPVKLTFRDVNMFAAFVVRNRTFVKVGNSTAIAAHVRGSEQEPFAMLATADAKIAKSAKRSFKQGDKVSAFVAQQ